MKKSGQRPSGPGQCGVAGAGDVCSGDDVSIVTVRRSVMASEEFIKAPFLRIVIIHCISIPSRDVVADQILIQLERC